MTKLGATLRVTFPSTFTTSLFTLFFVLVLATQLLSTPPLAAQATHGSRSVSAG